MTLQKGLFLVCVLITQNKYFFFIMNLCFTSVLPFISIKIKKILFVFPNCSAQIFGFVVTHFKSNNISIKASTSTELCLHKNYRYLQLLLCYHQAI